MATVITAPEPLEIDGPAVFLAGAIDMGAAVDWQAEVVSALSDCHLTLLNPRRAAFTPDTLDEQILWELPALERADYIFMWFPKDAKAPVAMLETGLYMRSGKLILGAEFGFYRRRNLELTAQREGVHLYSDVSDMVESLRRWTH